MSDGGQRLLDVIDDPNALESFLGGLTSESELLPSAESVENVVASLARSLEGDYEVDSPNETLFDTLEGSTNNLTDISQSYVPSDFENVSMSSQVFNSAMVSMHNGEMHQHQIQNSGSEQYMVTSNHTLMSNSSVTSNVSASLQHYTSHNTVCDSNPSVSTTSSISANNNNNSQFSQQHQQIQISQNPLLLHNNSSNSTSYVNASFQDLQKQQSIINQNQQLASLSSSNVDGQTSNSSLNMISVATPNTDGGITTTAFQQTHMNELTQHQGQIHIMGQSVNVGGNNPVITAVSNNELGGNSSSIQGSINSVTANTIQQHQQFMSNAATQQTLNQLVSGQTVNLSNMNVGGAQIIATSTGSIVTTGQGQANIIQQIQPGNAGQSYITVEQPTALIGPTTFGATNLALVTTGGAPTYAVVPTGTQFLSNAIMTQPQAIQTLTKGPNGTYFQTSSGAQIVATSNMNTMQTVNVTVANSVATKPKQPPQLLPKPQANGNSSTANGSTSGTDSVSSSSGTSTHTTQASGTISTPTENVVTQIFQQQQAAHLQGLQNQVVVTSVGNNSGSVTIPQHQSYTIGNAAGIGQVLVSQNPQQQQLSGTIVVNQYGQPMLLPTASTAQTGGLQFILRQQPTQQQVLTIQAPTGTISAQPHNTAGKQIVRYVSQVPQVAQSSGYGIQQIQTPNGPAWVAVRYPQATSTAGQFSHIQNETLVQAAPIQAQVSAPQIQLQTTQQHPQLHQQQSVPPSPQPQTPVTPAPPPTPPSQQQLQNQDATPDSSSEPPPAKKPKTKAKSNKKKVCLDLEQLLKQSGIMDEDLQDDSFDFSFTSQENQHNGYDSGISSLQDQNPQPMEIKESPVQNSMINTSGSKSETPKRPPAKSRKKKPPQKPKSPSPPPPPPIAPKSKGGSGKKKGGAATATPKAEIKTDLFNSKNKGPPKKLSSLDAVSATIAAVASASGSPSPPSSPISVSSPASSISSSVASPAMNLHKGLMHCPSPISVPTLHPVTTSNPIHLGSVSNSVSIATSTPTSTSGSPRIVQTIQLTPQNQHLLRNIQAQIARLLSLPKRNETEQTALQKLIVLQQQVIATGITVPNPTHLNTLAQTLNTNISSTVLQSSTLSSNAVAVTTTSADTNGTTGDKDSLAQISCNPSPNTVSSNLSNANSVSNPPTTLNPNPNKNSLSVPITSSDSALNNDNSKISNGSTNLTQIQIPTGVVKVASPNVEPKPNHGTPEDNKENTTSVPSLLVASSPFTTTTNTTNSLGQHHLQSFPTSFRTSVDEKKAEELKLANQKADEEKRARWRKEEFEMLLKRDQQCVVKPDYEIPFNSKRDAVERLMKYHILRDRNDMNLDDFDAEFADNAGLLLDKFHGMVAKHRSLLLKESMKEVGCAERVMLERMFVSEEKLKLEQDRLLVSQGEILELPPPPSRWVPNIKEMVDKEVKELERDSIVNQQVQSAIDSIIGFGNNNDTANLVPEEGEKIEYDAFGLPIPSNSYNGMNSTSSADIDEAVRSILS